MVSDETFAERGFLFNRTSRKLHNGNGQKCPAIVRVRIPRRKGFVTLDSRAFLLVKGEMMEVQKNWRLNYGIHRGTLTSRDVDTTSFATRDEAIKSYQERKDFHNGIGYLVWFAELISPEGEKEMLEQNPY